VAKRAGLPTSAFYAHFADMRRCLSAAYDAFFERCLTEVERAVDGEASWPEQVRDAVAAALEFLIETASHSRVFAVEGVGIGPPFLERLVSSLQIVAERLRGGRERYPRAAGLPACTEAVLVEGMVSRVRAHLLAEEYALLPQLEEEFVEILLTLYLGEAEAKRVPAAAASPPPRAVPA
jgi:AcrR family transcriptional regulator